MSDLIRLAKAALLSVVNNEGLPALLGKADGTLAYTLPDGSTSRTKCWARIGQGDSATELVVRCDNVPMQVNLPVRIADRDGQPTAIRADTARADVLTGGRPMTVPNHNWTHGRLGPDPLYVTGLAFLPLQAYPSTPAGLTVTVEQGFYRYQGAEYLFPTTTSGSLSSYVPAVGQHFVLLCLNRSTNALAVVEGGSSVAPVSGNPFTSAMVLTYVEALASTHFPLCAIRLYAGQTTITAQDIFMDLRFWGGEVGAVDEETVQDIIGAILVDSATIDFTYSDPTPSITAIVIDDSISNAKLRNSGALSVIGRSANSTGDPADISATAASDAVLRESGSTLGFGTVATAGIANDAVTNAKLANMTTKTYKGRTTGSTGDPEDVAAATVAADIQASVDHGSIAGLGDDDHTQYALLAGRASGQVLIGGTGAGETLNLRSTAHATKGKVTFGAAATTIYDGVNERFGVANATPLAILHVGPGADAPGSATTPTLYLSEAGFAHLAMRDSTNNVEAQWRAGTANVLFGTFTTHDLLLRTNNANRMAILSTGEVGISNTAPQALLHVGAGADAPGSGSTVIGYFSAAGATTVAVRDSTNNVEVQIRAGTTTGIIGNFTNHDLNVRTNNANRINVLSTGEVGIGVTAPTPTGVLSIQAGTSSDHANVGGTVYVTTAQVGNVGTGEDVLASVSLPASTLAQDGQYIDIEASGTTVSSANTKQVRLRFGTTGTNLIVDTGTFAVGNYEWVIRARVIRTGAATQKAYGTWLASDIPGSLNALLVFLETGLNQTLSGAITVEVTGQCGAAVNNEIVCESFVVTYGDNNT